MALTCTSGHGSTAVERKNFDNFPDEDVVCVSENGEHGREKDDSWILKNFLGNAHMSYKNPDVAQSEMM